MLFLSQAAENNLLIILLSGGGGLLRQLVAILAAYGVSLMHVSGYFLDNIMQPPSQQMHESVFFSAIFFKS